MKRLFSVLLVIGTLFASSSWASGTKTLLLADSETLLESAKDHFSEVFDAISTDIESDYTSRQLITGEGERIPFDDLFHRKSYQGVTALQDLQQEYAPETIALIWLESEKIHEYKAYGIKKRDLKVRLRVVDPVSGRTIIDRSISHKPKYRTESADEQEQEDARKEMLTKALAEFKIDRITAPLGRHMEAMKAAGNRVRVVIQGVDQKEYFDWRDGLLSMVESAGVVGDLRDHYDEAKDTLTIRGESGKEASDFFRSLYHSTMGSEILDNFDISRSGKVIELKELPADTKRLVISGLSPDRYHNRLGTYRSALDAVDGVRKIEYNFVSSGDASKLVFTFISKEDLPVVEEHLWSALRETGKVPNRELVSISENAIQYRVGEATGDLNNIVVVINNIAPGDYRAVGTEMDKIIKGLNVTGLDKSYSREDFQLRYLFSTTDRPVDVDTTIWDKISSLTDLENIVQDSGTGSMLGYFFNQDRADKQQIVVTVRHVAPSDYAKAGRMLVSTVKQIEGVEKFSYDYSEEEQVINMTFLYQGENAYSIDGVIWDRVKSNKDLSGLTTGLVDENSLEYLFGGDDKAVKDRIVVAVKGVSGGDYKHVSTTFAKILRSTNNVEEVRYGYSVKTRTVTFRIKYSGDGLFALEDAIQIGMSKSDLLKNVERGEDKGGRLIYRYKGEDEEYDDSDDGVGSIGNSGNTASLVDRLDKSVVYILADDEKGSSEGTGFFVSKSGYVMTNAHVVSDAARIYIRTLDEGRYRAEVIDTNERLDIALIRLVTGKKNFPAVKIGDSNKVRKGDSILMIGNPLGIDYEHSALTGIISGFNRREGSMQLSIPSYPGSSGSPVFDRKGKVVGVMKARAVSESSKIMEVEKEAVTVTTYEGVENIGLAVPINHVRPILGMVR